MKAAVLSAPGQPLIIEEVELDPPQAGEVLVKLKATGVCHSDVHYIKGDVIRDTRPFPIVLGHEGAGVISQVGAGVTDYAVGDHVILTYLPACGKCKWCHIGQPMMCDMGRFIPTGRMPDGTTRLHRTDGPNGTPGTDISNLLFVSTFAEYTVCPAASLVKVPDYVPLEHACLFGCGFSTGFGAVTNAVHVRPGESVTIVGCGGLGLAAVQGARLSGAGKIIAVDLHPEKLEMAKKFGATHTVRNDHDPQAAIDQIMDITWGVGTDHSFEFVGFDQFTETFHIAFHAARKGGTFCVMGVGSSTAREMPIDPYTLTLFRKKIQGVLFGDSRFLADLPRYVQLMLDGKIDMAGMVTQELRLEDINTAVANINAGNKVARQVIRFD